MADEPTRPEAERPETSEPATAAPGSGLPPVQPPDVDPGYAQSGVPTFESVREKIETRYGTALGSAELDAETPEGRRVEDQYQARQRAAAEKLNEIRASMHNREPS